MTAPLDLARVRADFDQIASFGGHSGAEYYDAFLIPLVPAGAAEVLDVGCGVGRLSAAIASDDRRVTGIDLSPEMIARARRENHRPHVTYECADFLSRSFEPASFDCIVTAAAVHHMPLAAAVERMVTLLRPGGRLILHDLRRDSGWQDAARAYSTLLHHVFIRFVRTGRPRSPAHVRAAWLRHCKDEQYLSWDEAQERAAALLPGSRVFYHWMWRYTIVWDKPSRSE